MEAERNDASTRNSKRPSRMKVKQANYGIITLAILTRIVVDCRPNHWFHLCVCVRLHLRQIIWHIER